MRSFNGTGKLRGFKAYFFKALKFFDLRDERMSPVVFSITLLVSCLGVVLQYPAGEADEIDIASQVNPSLIPLIILANIVIKLSISVYLTGCIKELKGEVYSLKSCAELVIKRSFKILAAYFIYSLITTVLLLSLVLKGLFFLAIPILIVNVMYQFNTCYIVDRNYGVIAAFKASRKLTHGYKWRIFVLTFAFTAALLFISSIILEIFITSGSLLIWTFVLCFVLSLYNMMNEKLIALIYYDLEYGAYEAERMLGGGEF